MAQKNVRTTLGMEIMPVTSDSAAATPSSSSSGIAAASPNRQGPALFTLSTLLSPAPRQGPSLPAGPPSVLHVPPNNPIITTNNSAINVLPRPGVDSTFTVIQSTVSGPNPNPPTAVAVAVGSEPGGAGYHPLNPLDHVGVPGSGGTSGINNIRIAVATFFNTHKHLYC